MINELYAKRFVIESNMIEGINRDPTTEEVEELFRILALKEVTVSDLEQFVAIYEPSARLRREFGLNVRIGGHFPPAGGPDVEIKLTELLRDVRAGLDPWTAHCRYEALHPFSDGNGRSGRALWARQMVHVDGLQLGFLHCFYYQTLSKSSR